MRVITSGRQVGDPTNSHPSGTLSYSIPESREKYRHHCSLGTVKVFWRTATWSPYMITFWRMQHILNRRLITFTLALLQEVYSQRRYKWPFDAIPENPKTTNVSSDGTQE
jgi:hypothetical protein